MSRTARIIVAQPLPSGTILRERYQIVELIGQGGMGAVYKAEDLRLRGRLCAVKEVLPEVYGLTEITDEIHEQFYQEASILARLDHPNLPKVSDFFAEGGREYLVMDFIPGHDLESIIIEARQAGTFLDEHQVLVWASQICDALEYLHGQVPPVLHRDIKPANIKVTPEGRIKLVDFGLVKVLTPDESRTITVVQGRGTAAYTPLEQYGGDTDHTDPRTDIYALGATLYHLLTGTPPADAKERFLHPGSLRPIRDINPNVSLRTEQAILSAMAMHPDDRPPSIQVFRHLLLGTNPLGSGDLTGMMLQRLSWQDALQANRWLLTLIITLLVIAIMTTIFSPAFPYVVNP